VIETVHFLSSQRFEPYPKHHANQENKADYVNRKTIPKPANEKESSQTDHRDPMQMTKAQARHQRRTKGRAAERDKRQQIENNQTATVDDVTRDEISNRDFGRTDENQHDHRQAPMGRPDEPGPSRLTLAPENHTTSRQVNDENKEYRSYIGSESAGIATQPTLELVPLTCLVPLLISTQSEHRQTL
jgi:hypothetical protein